MSIDSPLDSGEVRVFALSLISPLAEIQVLVDLAELQDREVGDGTTSVVIFAAELLKVELHITGLLVGAYMLLLQLAILSSFFVFFCRGQMSWSRIKYIRHL